MIVIIMMTKVAVIIETITGLECVVCLKNIPKPLMKKIENFLLIIESRILFFHS